MADWEAEARAHNQMLLRQHNATPEFAFRRHGTLAQGVPPQGVKPQKKVALPLSKVYPDGLSAQIEHGELNKDKAKYVDVPVSRLRATQTSVDRDNPLSKRTSSRDRSPSGANLPTGIRHPNGEVHLTDGHHRADAAVRRGDKTLRTKVIDVNG